MNLRPNANAILVWAVRPFPSLSPPATFYQLNRISTHETRARTAPSLITMVSLNVYVAFVTAVTMPSVVASSSHPHGSPSGVSEADIARRSRPSSAAPRKPHQRAETAHMSATRSVARRSYNRRSRWSTRHSKHAADRKRQGLPIGQEPVTFNIFAFETASPSIPSPMPTFTPEPTVISVEQNGVMSQGTFVPMTDRGPPKSKTGALIGGGIVLGLIALLAIIKLSCEVLKRRKSADTTPIEQWRRPFSASTRTSTNKSRSMVSEESSRYSRKSAGSAESGTVGAALEYSSEKKLPGLPSGSVRTDDTERPVSTLDPPREPAPAFPPPEPPLPLVPTRYVNMLLSKATIKSHKQSKSQAWVAPIPKSDSGRPTSLEHKRSQSAPEKSAAHVGEEIADYWDVIDVISRPNSNGTSLVSNVSARSSRSRGGKSGAEA